MQKTKIKESLKQDYFEKGYCIVRRAVENEFLQFMEKSVEYMIKNLEKFPLEKKHIHYTGPNNNIISSLHNLIDFIPEYGSWMLNSPVDKLIEFIFGDPLDDWIYNSSYFAKPPVNGLATTPHADNAFFNMLPDEKNIIPNLATCWFGLDRSDKNVGGLYYYEGSHKTGPYHHAPIGSKGASMAITPVQAAEIEKNYHKEYIRLNRGDIVIHNPEVIHGSDANHSKLPRRGFNFSRKSKRCKRDEEGWSRYLNQLDGYLLYN